MKLPSLLQIHDASERHHALKRRLVSGKTKRQLPTCGMAYYSHLRGIQLVALGDL